MDVLTPDTFMAINIFLLFFFVSTFAWGQTQRSDAFIDMMSWQQEGSVKINNIRSNFIVTNRALCAGGSMGLETATYRSFVDGCFLYGQGNVGAEKNTVTYDQSDISVYGLKASVGSGFFVSSKKAEIGFKIPLMIVSQTYTKPNQASLTEPSPVLLMGSLYGRWPFEKWFFQTEFSKIVGNDFVMFSLGAGYKF